MSSLLAVWDMRTENGPPLSMDQQLRRLPQLQTLPPLYLLHNRLLCLCFLKLAEVRRGFLSGHFSWSERFRRRQQDPDCCDVFLLGFHRHRHGPSAHSTLGPCL